MKKAGLQNPVLTNRGPGRGVPGARLCCWIQRHVDKKVGSGLKAVTYPPMPLPDRSIDGSATTKPADLFCIVFRGSLFLSAHCHSFQSLRYDVQES